MSNELSLKEFVKETLKSIAEGIYEAKTDVTKEHGTCCVAPGYIEGESNTKEQYIKFDIAVTLSKKTADKASGGASVKVFNVAGEKSNTTSNEKQNRIQFEVPFYAQAIPSKKVD